MWFIRLIGMLLLLQGLVQVVMGAVRFVSGDKRHWILHIGRAMVGVRDDVDASEAAENARLKSLLVFISLFGCFNDFALLNQIASSVIGTMLVDFIGIFLVFRLYFEGRGCGVSIYFKEKRLIGLDWHQWLVFYENNRFLKKNEQYFINRPHIDVPCWNIKHWPWETSVPTSPSMEPHIIQDKRIVGTEKTKEKQFKKASKHEYKMNRTGNDSSNQTEVELSDELWS